jgi:hypothetical protein
MSVRLLVDLAQGGFAETMTQEERDAVHIQGQLDDFIEERLRHGHQVILTGNPGDGKTQYILRMKGEFPSSKHFYLPDASEYEDYRTLLEDWESALEAGQPGVLAINDGPLFEMITSYQEEFEFLNDVEEQFRNQLTTEAEPGGWPANDRFCVIDLNNRDILTPPIIREAFDKLTDDPLTSEEFHDHSGECHIQKNIQDLRREDVRERYEDLLDEVKNLGEHVTIRDLFNFLAYSIVGDEGCCKIDISPENRFYELTFSGEGKLFDLVREVADPRYLSDPFLDSKLWTEVRRENLGGESDTSEDLSTLEEDFLREKKRALLGDRTSPEVDLANLFDPLTRQWFNHRNANGRTQESKEELIESINRYFSPTDRSRTELRVWLSHNYRSKDSQVLVSRTQVAERDLELAVPNLHSEIEDAMEYTADFYYLQHVDEEREIRLKVTQALFRALLGSDIPYVVRERRHERRILNFMEKLEVIHAHARSRQRYVLQRTEDPKAIEMQVTDDSYSIEEGGGLWRSR